MFTPYKPTPATASANMTLQEFVADVYWPMKQALHASTKKSYKRDLNRILPTLGHLKLKEVRHLSIQFLMNQYTSAKMASNARETLSSVLALARSLEIIEVNYAADRYLYPDALPGEKAHDQGVVLGSFAKIYAYLKMLKHTVPGSALERASLLGFGGGLRKGEIFGMDAQFVDLKNHLFGVYQTYVDADGGGFVLLPPKTPSSIREAPLIKYVTSRFQEIGVPSHGPFITNEKGDRQNPETASKTLLRWRRRYNMPDVTFSSMRHSFATSCIKAGIPIVDVSLWLGHSNPNVTVESYIRPSLDDLQDDAQRINRIINAGQKHAVAEAEWTPEAEEFTRQLLLAS